MGVQLEKVLDNAVTTVRRALAENPMPESKHSVRSCADALFLREVSMVAPCPELEEVMVAVDSATRDVTHLSTAGATTQNGDMTTRQRAPARSAAGEAGSITAASSGGVGFGWGLSCTTRMSFVMKTAARARTSVMVATTVAVAAAIAAKRGDRRDVEGSDRVPLRQGRVVPAERGTRRDRSWHDPPV